MIFVGEQGFWLDWIKPKGLPSSYTDTMIKIDVETIEQTIGVNFCDKALLQRALTHRSYLNEDPDYPFEDNERLEFLGDAVLDFVTAEYLYHHYPEMPEGRLTNLRSALVRTKQLSLFAKELNMGDYLLLGRGEDDSGGRKRTAILCDAFEALLGAIYLDRGLDVASNFIVTIIEPTLQEIIATNADRDPKSMLQELAQSFHHVTPTYRTVLEIGPDHAKEFTVQAMVGEKSYGEGMGLSKQDAAQAAAEIALENLQKEVALIVHQQSTNFVEDIT